MGDLIVGNYDLQGHVSGKFNAFVYNMKTRTFQPLYLEYEPGKVAKLITAYGIWQHGIDSTHYTIAGGLYDHDRALNVGYLVDYNLDTNKTSHLKMFKYDKAPSLITHFEGITKYGEEITEFGPRRYSLAAMGDQDAANTGVAFAIVERQPDGSFGPAKWEEINVANSSGITTGNTVLTNNLYGVYTTGNGIQSYVAVISS